MRLKRDPQDRRYRERLAGSYLASLLFHVLLAAALFAVIANSSEEGATESQIGGSIVTLEQRAPVVAQAPVKTEQAAPVPHAPRIAPVRHAQAARPAHAPQPPLHHELSKFSPTAPPNPTPLPQASPEPNVQPTQAVVEPQPIARVEIPAVPTSVPTAVSVAVAVTMPPTAAPSPVPTTAPTAQPSPRPPAPTAAPTAKPHTPAPTAPTAAPTATAVAAVKASAAPSASPAAPARATAAPAVRPGVPSPSPTQGAPEAPATKGTAPSPGPKGLGSPGPRAGNAGTPKAGPERPVAVNPTPSPASTARAQSGRSNAPDINAKLRSLLPHNDVNPNQGSYRPPVSLGGSLEPTPPPEILAITKYYYEERGSGGDSLIKMWVTNVHKEGAVTMCDGWLVRYPPAAQPSRSVGTASNPQSGSIAISSSIGGTVHPGLGAPIVEAHASAICSQRHLVPYAPSPAASP